MIVIAIVLAWWDTVLYGVVYARLLIAPFPLTETLLHEREP